MIVYLSKQKIENGVPSLHMMAINWLFFLLFDYALHESARNGWLQYSVNGLFNKIGHVT